jgi:hypothetical protein
MNFQNRIKGSERIAKVQIAITIGSATMTSRIFSTFLELAV